VKHWRFDFHERQRFLGLLDRFENLAASRGLYGPVLLDIGAIMREICGGANLKVEPGIVSFTAWDGREYFANGAGLWAFDEKCIRMTPRAWWLAALRTRAFLLNTRGWRRDIFGAKRGVVGGRFYPSESGSEFERRGGKNGKVDR